MKKNYYVYLLASKKNGTIYTGIASNLKKRVFAHKSNLFKGFTEKYNVKKLVYFESHDRIDIAILREKRIKKWKRSWKVKLIESMNPGGKIYIMIFQIFNRIIIFWIPAFAGMTALKGLK